MNTSMNTTPYNVWNPSPIDAYERQLTYTKYMCKRKAHTILIDIEHLGYAVVKQHELSIRLKAEAMRRVFGRNEIKRLSEL